ncbi:hypothetical protein HAX54_039412 [Datura stramonium]|uniref:Uncharacterized protein n=1 Tax=Datura stramonium TaxID=4076 RepID=A0ABS8VQJ6_DATST|nr:hypothetical protein [Datura stramonium]
MGGRYYCLRLTSKAITRGDIQSKISTLKCKCGLTQDPNTPTNQSIQGHSSMIRKAIKMDMKQCLRRWKALCGRVDVLEDKVVTLRKGDRRKVMILPMSIDLNIPAVVLDSPIAERSPPDDWCIGDSVGWYNE